MSEHSLAGCAAQTFDFGSSESSFVLLGEGHVAGTLYRVNSVSLCVSILNLQLPSPQPPVSVSCRELPILLDSSDTSYSFV